MGNAKQFFAATPARAIGDTRLTGLHMKALAAIAIHDRLSAPRNRGQGCWAGNKRLAEMIGCNYSNLSTALTNLATWGYIDRRINPMNRKRRILFVIYSDQDAAFVGAKPSANGLPADKLSDDEMADDGLLIDKDDAEIVCPDFQNGDISQRLNGGEYIPLKRGIDSAEAGDSNSAETASPYGDEELLGKKELELSRRSLDGKELGRIQTLLKQLENHALSIEDQRELQMSRGVCEALENAHTGEDVGYWAQRLASEIDWRLESEA
jgi:DNA-binding MarR family transcriptional regulator